MKSPIAVNSRLQHVHLGYYGGKEVKGGCSKTHLNNVKASKIIFVEAQD
jgi:hypothetical protein